MQKLEEIVRKRRETGESIMLVGTTCSEDLTPEMSPSGVQSLQSEGEAGFFRTIVVTPGSVQEDSSPDVSLAARAHTIKTSISRTEEKKIRNINLRHIQDMARSLDPVASVAITDMQRATEGFRKFAATLLPESYSWSVMTYDEVHRIALTAHGLQIGRAHV